MPYPEQLVQPMRAELTRIGVKELLTADDVDSVFADNPAETTLLVVNSVCGCAAANARPAVSLAMQAEVTPEKKVTVFAGQDLEATEKAREYLPGIPPSSPFIALFKKSDPVFVLERRHIEGRSASAIAMNLVEAYRKYCGPEGSEPEGSEPEDVERPDETESSDSSSDLPPTFRSIL